jgi:hypothetical protein
LRVGAPLRRLFFAFVAAASEAGALRFIPLSKISIFRLSSSTAADCLDVVAADPLTLRGNSGSYVARHLVAAAPFAFEKSGFLLL